MVLVFAFNIFFFKFVKSSVDETVDQVTSSINEATNPNNVLQNGVSAEARILDLEAGGVSQGGASRKIMVNFDVEVQPESGEPYQTTMSSMVPELKLSQLQPGATVRVRYDPNNPHNVALEQLPQDMQVAAGQQGQQEW